MKTSDTIPRGHGRADHGARRSASLTVGRPLPCLPRSTDIVGPPPHVGSVPERGNSPWGGLEPAGSAQGRAPMGHNPPILRRDGGLRRPPSLLLLRSSSFEGQVEL